ncbi:MAG: hypothetical protein ACJ76T_09375 [Solirubrobacteraceae bacterium]
MGLGIDRVLDPSRHGVDRPGELMNRGHRVLLPPAGDVGHRLDRDLQARTGTHDVGDCVDEDLGARARP